MVASFPSPAELVAIAQRYEDKVVAFCQDLVRIHSVNGRDPENPIALRIMEEAEKLDLEANLRGIEEDRKNVVVTIGSGEKGFGFIGHMDTVAEGAHELWMRPPFEGAVSAGKIFGRGAADNKAGIACALYTLALLRESELIPPDLGRVLLAGVVDEESGACSPLGVRHLLDEGILDVDAAIYTYASDVICVGHRGLLRLEIHTKGKSVHSGSGEWDRGEDGVNAVTGLAAILLELERMELEGSTHPAFPGLRGMITPGTMISGGDWEGMVPAWAKAIVDIRLLPNQSADLIYEAVEEVIVREIANRPALEAEIQERARLPAAVIPVDHKLVELAEKYTQQVTGDTWETVGAGPANEGYMLIEAGIPTLPGFGPTGGNAHTENEWVAVSSLTPTIAMYAGIAHEYLASLKE